MRLHPPSPKNAILGVVRLVLQQLNHFADQIISKPLHKFSSRVYSNNVRLMVARFSQTEKHILSQINRYNMKIKACEHVYDYTQRVLNRIMNDGLSSPKRERVRA